MNFFVKAFLDKVVNNPEETGKIIKSLVEWYQQKQKQNEEAKKAVAKDMGLMAENLIKLEQRVTDLEKHLERK